MKRLRRIVARTQEIAEPTSDPAADEELPAAGAPGRTSVLPRFRSRRNSGRLFYRAEDATTLADLVGAKRVAELVMSSLAIRPTGGRAWVDVLPG